ncbi:hypothetical protein YC2023_083167 [Brassica napus]
MHEIKGFKEKNIPTACLKIMIEQLAEFQQGADVDVPAGLYDAHQCHNFVRQKFISITTDVELCNTSYTICLSVPRPKAWKLESFKLYIQINHISKFPSERAA